MREVCQRMTPFEILAQIVELLLKITVGCEILAIVLIAVMWFLR